MKLHHLINLIRSDLQQLKKLQIQQLTIEKYVYSVKYLIARNDLQIIRWSNLDKEAKTELKVLLKFCKLENTKYKATEIHLAIQKALQDEKLNLSKNLIKKTISKNTSNKLEIIKLSANSNILNIKLNDLMNLLRKDLQQLKKFKIKQLTIEKHIYSVRYLIARNDLQVVDGPILNKEAKKELQELLKFYQLENTKYKSTKIHLAAQKAIKSAKLKLSNLK